MTQRKNNLVLIKHIIIDDVSYPVYSKVNVRCENIIVRFNSDQKVFEVTSFRHISEADYNFYNLDRLLI